MIGPDRDQEEGTRFEPLPETIAPEILETASRLTIAIEKYDPFGRITWEMQTVGAKESTIRAFRKNEPGRELFRVSGPYGTPVDHITTEFPDLVDQAVAKAWVDLARKNTPSLNISQNL